MESAVDPTERSGRLEVGVVGAGRVGSVLGAALIRAGHRVVATSGVSRESVRRAERHLPGAERLPVDQVVERAQLVLLAVPDDVLAGLIEGLADTGGWRAGQLVAHVSGAHGVDILAPATRAGALPLALHPVMTFTDRPEDVDRLAGVSFGVTAPEPLRPVAEALVVEMGGEPVWVPESARPLYHASLTVASNHLVTLVNDSMTLLDGAGVAEPARLVAPLLSAALDNVLRLGDAALTGPVSRGDVATVTSHVQTLARRAPEVLPSYLAMARRTAERAHAAGRLSAAQTDAVLAALETT